MLKLGCVGWPQRLVCAGDQLGGGRETLPAFSRARAFRQLLRLKDLTCGSATTPEYASIGSDHCVRSGHHLNIVGDPDARCQNNIEPREFSARSGGSGGASTPDASLLSQVPPVSPLHNRPHLDSAPKAPVRKSAELARPDRRNG